MRKIYTVLLVITFLVPSCKKETPGPEGPQGPEGIAGKDGATILGGDRAPGVAMGNVGDFFLDLSSGMLYGPKTAAGWGEPISLKGEPGPTGNAGATFMGGDGAPTDDTGKSGDYYFDKVNLAVFGPKAESGWGSPVSLKSPEQAGIRTLIKENARFENITKVPDWTAPDGTVFPGNTFTAEMALAIANLEEYTQYGLVVTYIKPAGSGRYVSDMADSVAWSWRRTLLDGDAEAYINFSRPKMTSTEIVFHAMMDGWSEGQEYIDFNTPEHKQQLSHAFPFDIKIVLIPASSVEYLTVQHPQGIDQQNVTRFLRID